MQGNDPTTVILSLDLANLYASVISGEDCLTKALVCCLDGRNAFAPEGCATRDPNRDKDWYEKMTTLSDSMEDRVFKLLLNLVKIEKDKTNSPRRAGVQNDVQRRRRQGKVCFLGLQPVVQAQGAQRTLLLRAS